MQFPVESAATVVRVISGRGKGAGFRSGSQRDTKRGTSVREKERDAGKQTPREKRRCEQRIRGDNHARAREPELWL